MKIAHVTAFAPYGGADIQCEMLATCLHRQGVAQRVMAGGNPERSQRLRQAGLDVVDLELPGRLAFLARKRLDGELKRFTPDLVLSWRPEVSVLVERGGYKHIGRLPATFNSKAYMTCDALLAPSKQRADAAVAAGWSMDKIHTVPDLPSIALARPNPVEIERRTLFTPATARIVFSAGRLEKSKSFDTLIDAVARLSSVYLWIAGDGPDRAFFEAHAYAKGMKPRVRFLGWVDDLQPYFRASDLFVYPAKQEDLSDIVVEAWSAGAPVIAADSLGPGLLIRHQENGVLVPVGDPVAMSDAIAWLLADQNAAERIGAAGKKSFDEEYEPSRLIDRYLKIFSGLGRTDDESVAAAGGT
ncbi:MAG: glycosyltransferase [Rhodobacteraceae bacterium]|nr:glycosyltransferase [Paracoccaceae bacterium]